MNEPLSLLYEGYVNVHSGHLCLDRPVVASVAMQHLSLCLAVWILVSENFAC